jgi:pimeloyl-ACP methyl ester carboxylesterase
MPSERDLVCIPGAWHGAWVWDRVLPLLRQEGFRVHTLTLAGVGDRAREWHQFCGIGLKRHIRDVVDALQRDDLRDVLLLPWSYGGLPATGAACQVPDRVAGIIYLDAFFPLPNRNQPATMLQFRDEPDWLTPFRHTLQRGVLTSQPVPPPPLRFLGFHDASTPEAQWVRQQLTPMPIRLFDGFMRFHLPPDSVRLGYIRCVYPETLGEGFEPYAAYAQAHGWPSRDVTSGHAVMVLEPAAMVRAVASIAAEWPTPVARLA